MINHVIRWKTVEYQTQGSGLWPICVITVDFCSNGSKTGQLCLVFEWLSRLKCFFYVHLGYSLNFIFVFHSHVMGAYLRLAEVKWVKTGVPGVKPLLEVKGWVYASDCCWIMCFEPILIAYSFLDCHYDCVNCCMVFAVFWVEIHNNIVIFDY